MTPSLHRSVPQKEMKTENKKKTEIQLFYSGKTFFLCVKLTFRIASWKYLQKYILTHYTGSKVTEPVRDGMKNEEQ